MTDNRRASFRHTVDLPVELSPAEGGAPAERRIGNLSLGGAFVLGEKIAMGRRLKVRFMIPTQADAVEVQATVRWVTDEGIGLQFDGLRARDVWSLGKYFEQLEG
ncbi:MAG: PilZ domain-containing protein [Kofleriaceae bacterium]